MTVTTEQRALWRRLAEEATPGEWTLIRSRSQAFDTVKVSEGRFVTVEGRSEAEANANAAFIAASREAVPALLEALEEAEADLDAVGHALGVCYDHDHGCGGHGPVDAMVQAAREGCAARGDAIDATVRAESAESERDALALRVRSADALDAAGFDLACTVSAFIADARKRLGPEWTSALDVLTRDLDAYNDAADRARAALSPPATPGATTKENDRE